MTSKWESYENDWCAQKPEWCSDTSHSVLHWFLFFPPLASAKDRKIVTAAVSSSLDYLISSQNTRACTGAHIMTPIHGTSRVNGHLVSSWDPLGDDINNRDRQDPTDRCRMSSLLQCEYRPWWIHISPGRTVHLVRTTSPPLNHELGSPSTPYRGLIYFSGFQLGTFCHVGDIYQCLETFFIVSTRGSYCHPMGGDQRGCYTSYNS